MTLSDPIADMLTRIRNAGKAKFNHVDIPGSKMKMEIAKVMKNEGYIRNYKFIKDGKQGTLRIYMKYGPDQQSAIMQIQRVSKPSKRVYLKCKDIKPVYNGTGVAVLSTPKGIMTDGQAKKENLGGEIVCTIW